MMGKSGKGMESTIIHIGYHKSASTYLQQKIFPQLPVNFLFFAGENRKYLNMIESKKGLDVEAIRAWVADEISLKYGNKRYPVTVLSHEELSGHPHGYGTISGFTTAKNIKQTFPEAKILILIRNQLAYLSSLYTYRVAIKGYETRSFARFLTEEGGKGLFDHLEYHKLIEFYHELFGPEQVIVLPVELLSSSPADFYGRLLRFMELPARTIHSARPINVSTKSLVLLTFWRSFNYLFGQFLFVLRFLFGQRPGNFPGIRSTYYNLKRGLTGKFNKFLSKGKQLDITKMPNYLDFINRFRESNRHLNTLVDIDLSSLGYPVETS